MEKGNHVSVDDEKCREEFERNLPSTVSLLTTTQGAKVYLVGTGHFSIESQKDVEKVIRIVKPHAIIVELCNDRAGIIRLNEEELLRESKNISLDKIRSIIRESGAFPGLMYVLFLKLCASLVKSHGIAPGGEFRVALQEALKIPNCNVYFGDRPIRITLKRALTQLSCKEEIERCKQQDILEEMLGSVAQQYPKLSEVFVDERDVYLAYNLEQACYRSFYNPPLPDRNTPLRVVGVVGIGHCSGIKKNWGKVNISDVKPLLLIPKPTRTDKIVKFLLKASLCGITAVGVYYILPKSCVGAVKSAFSLVAFQVKRPSLGY